MKKKIMGEFADCFEFYVDPEKQSMIIEVCGQPYEDNIEEFLRVVADLVRFNVVLAPAVEIENRARVPKPPTEGDLNIARASDLRELERKVGEFYESLESNWANIMELAKKIDAIPTRSDYNSELRVIQQLETRLETLELAKLGERPA